VNGRYKKFGYVHMMKRQSQQDVVSLTLKVSSDAKTLDGRAPVTFCTTGNGIRGNFYPNGYMQNLTYSNGTWSASNGVTTKPLTLSNCTNCYTGDTVIQATPIEGCIGDCFVDADGAPKCVTNSSRVLTTSLFSSVKPLYGNWTVSNHGFSSVSFVLVIVDGQMEWQCTSPLAMYNKGVVTTGFNGSSTMTAFSVPPATNCTARLSVYIEQALKVCNIPECAAGSSFNVSSSQGVNFASVAVANITAAATVSASSLGELPTSIGRVGKDPKYQLVDTSSIPYPGTGGCSGGYWLWGYDTVDPQLPIMRYDEACMTHEQTWNSCTAKYPLPKMAEEWFSLPPVMNASPMTANITMTSIMTNTRSCNAGSGGMDNSASMSLGINVWYQTVQVTSPSNQSYVAEINFAGSKLVLETYTVRATLVSFTCLSTFRVIGITTAVVTFRYVLDGRGVSKTLNVGGTSVSVGFSPGSNIGSVAMLVTEASVELSVDSFRCTSNVSMITAESLPANLVGPMFETTSANNTYGPSFMPKIDFGSATVQVSLAIGGLTLFLILVILICLCCYCCNTHKYYKHTTMAFKGVKLD